MDKQTIQELEIIIKAQCENARKDLKKIAQETQTTANKISKSMKSMNDSGALDKVKNNLQEAKNEVKEFGEEVRKIKINQNGFFSYEVKADFSDFEEQYQKALDEYNKKQIEVPVEIKETTTQSQVVQPQSNVSNSNLNNSPEKITVSSDVSEVENIRKALKSAKEEIIELRKQASSLELKGLNPYSILSFRDSLKLLADQATTTIPVLTEFRLAVEQNLSGAFGNSLLQKAYSTFNNLKQKVDELATNVSSKMSAVKTSMTNAFTGVSGSINSKLNPIIGFFSEVGKIGSGTFGKLKQNLSNISNFIKKPITSLKQLVTQFKNVKSQSDKVSKSATNFGNSFGKSLKSGISSIKTFALSLLSIRTAFTLVSKAANSYLSIDTQLNDSIQNSWSVLGSLLAPALEYVAGLFSKLVNSVASFIKALTGIDLVARANSKALDKQAKSASNASKSLAGIDDIDVLSTGSGGGSDESTTIKADVDSGPFESMVAKMKDIFSTLFDPIKSAWDNVGVGVIDSATQMFISLGDLATTVGASLFEVWTNGTGQEIIENMLLGWQQIFDIVSLLAQALQNAWINAGTGTSIIQNIANIFSNIQQFGLSIGDSIKKWIISESFQEALKNVFSFINDILTYIQNISSWILELYEKYAKPVIDSLLLLISDLINAISDVWNACKPVIEKIAQWVAEKIEPVIADVCSALQNVIEVARGILEFISGVFTGDWSKAWSGIKKTVENTWSFIKNIFSAGGQIFDGIVEALANVFKTIVNAIIRGINKVIAIPFKTINGFLNKIRNASFLNISPFKGFWKEDPLPVPQIPELATGNVAYERTTAVFGEYANARSNPEITSPVSLMKESFRDVLNEFEFGGTRIDTLKIDVAGDNFYQGAVDYINEENVRKGVNIIKEA